MKHTINARIFSWGITVLAVLLLLTGWLAGLRVPLLESLPAGLRTVAIGLVGLFGAGLFMLAVFGLARLFTRWFPTARGFELTYTQSDWEDFHRRTWSSTLVFLVLTALLSLLLYRLLLLLTSLSDSLAMALFVFPARPGFWTLPALVGGSCLGLLLTYAIYRRRLKDRFPRYLAFHNQRLGFDQRKAGLALVLFGLFLTVGLVWIGLNLRVRLDYGGIARESFFGLVEERYTYGEIALIQEQDSVYTIRFKDGIQWRSGVFYDENSVRDAMEYAAQRSGAVLERVE